MGSVMIIEFTKAKRSSVSNGMLQDFLINPTLLHILIDNGIDSLMDL